MKESKTESTEWNQLTQEQKEKLKEIWRRAMQFAKSDPAHDW